jgi:Fur family transcriptional regulator, iron response regulator
LPRSRQANNLQEKEPDGSMAKTMREPRDVTAEDLASSVTARLRHAGLRPTRQRVELAGLLFRDQDRHVTAESLHDEVTQAGLRVSLATVYNTLHQFTEAGLLRQVIVDAARSYFDTNTGDHQHFFLEKEGLLIDIPGDTIAVAGVPIPPAGLAVDRVDVVVRVRRS